jgi:hypothetical protein
MMGGEMVFTTGPPATVARRISKTAALTSVHVKLARTPIAAPALYATSLAPMSLPFQWQAGAQWWLQRRVDRTGSPNGGHRRNSNAHERDCAVQAAVIDGVPPTRSIEALAQIARRKPPENRATENRTAVRKKH